MFFVFYNANDSDVVVLIVFLGVTYTKCWRRLSDIYSSCINAYCRTTRVPLSHFFSLIFWTNVCNVCHSVSIKTKRIAFYGLWKELNFNQFWGVLGIVNNSKIINSWRALELVPYSIVIIIKLKEKTPFFFQYLFN